MSSKTGLSRTGLGRCSPSLMVGGFNSKSFARSLRTLNTPPGHAGSETVEHVAENLPGRLESALMGLLVGSEWRIDPVSIRRLLSEVIISYDDSLTKDLYDLFPGGVDELSKLSDDEVKAVIHDRATGGPNHAKVARCMQGSTVLLCLLDPKRGNIWVASLGDCQAGVSRVCFCHTGTCTECRCGVLGVRPDDGKDWDVSLLSANHHAALPSEAEAIRLAHPEESGAIINDRVLGGIAITRGLLTFSIHRDNS